MPRRTGSKCPLVKVYHQWWSLFQRNVLIENQILRLGNSGIRATALDVKRSRKDDNEDSEAEPICDLILSDKEKLEAGYYNVVVEAHCILDW